MDTSSRDLTLSTSERLGVPSSLSPAAQEELIRALEELWEAFAGRRTGSLTSDLDDLGTLFGKRGDARRLRATVARLPRPHAELPEQLAMPVYDGALITPVGRVVLECLRDSRSRGELGIAPANVGEAALIVAAAYQRWFVSWAEGQLHGTLSPPVLAFAVFLLLSGAEGPARALPLPADEIADRELADAINPILDAGAMAMGGDPIKQESLRSSWIVSQATRRLGPFGLVRTSRGGRGSDADLWIDSDRREVFAKELGARLSSRPGAKVALTDLRRAYDRRRPRLLALGIAHDDPLSASRVIDQLSRAIRPV